jgi:hypothetical protein
MSYNGYVEIVNLPLPVAASPDIDGTELKGAVIPDSRQDVGGIEAEGAILAGEEGDTDEGSFAHGYV